MRSYFGGIATGAITAIVGFVLAFVPSSVGATQITLTAATVSLAGPACADHNAAAALQRYPVRAGQSLNGFARAHGGPSNGPANVLGFTYECTPGWASPAVIRYVNRGNWNAPMTGIHFMWSWRG